MGITNPVAPGVEAWEFFLSNQLEWLLIGIVIGWMTVAIAGVVRAFILRVREYRRRERWIKNYLRRY